MAFTKTTDCPNAPPQVQTHAHPHLQSHCLERVAVVFATTVTVVITLPDSSEAVSFVCSLSS